MASLSFTKKEIEAIRFASEIVRSVREGADEDVVKDWPMEELDQVESKMRAASRRRRSRVP